MYTSQRVIFSKNMFQNAVFRWNCSGLRCFEGLLARRECIDRDWYSDRFCSYLRLVYPLADSDDFLADGDLRGSPRKFSHVGVIQLLLKMPQNRSRGHPTEKKRMIFGHFLRGWPTLASIFGAQTAEIWLHHRISYHQACIKEYFGPWGVKDPTSQARDTLQNVTFSK